MKTDTLKKMLLMLLCVVSVNMTALGKELVSDVLPIADPYILFYNDTYYAYGTSRADGFEVYSSKDMKSWERSPAPKTIYPRKNLLYSVPGAENAPTISCL